MAYRIVMLLMLALCGQVVAEEEASRYPSRPVTVIVPFAAGGGLDISTRLVTKYMERELGQQITVVNRTQGGNIQGNIEGISAEPDGYTVLAWGNGLVTDELIIRNVPYTYTDVVPVCLFSEAPEVIVVEAGFARENDIKTLDDLFECARNNPGMITIGMGGNWTPHDFLRLKMESQAGVSFNRMPFLGGGLALEATMKGNCNVALPFLAELLPHANSEALVPLAVAYGRRVAQLPELPCTVELGYPEMTQTIWRVLSVPMNTPENIVARLEDAYQRALQDPELWREAKGIGVNLLFRNSRQTRDFLRREHGAYVIKTEEWGIRKE